MTNDQLIHLMLDAVEHTPGDRRAILAPLGSVELAHLRVFLKSFTSAALNPSGQAPVRPKPWAPAPPPGRERFVRVARKAGAKLDERGNLDCDGSCDFDPCKHCPELCAR